MHVRVVVGIRKNRRFANLSVSTSAYVSVYVKPLKHRQSIDLCTLTSDVSRGVWHSRPTTRNNEVVGESGKQALCTCFVVAL